jgi:hypothetical protein
MLQDALDKVNELIALDMGSLVEDKGRREKVRLFMRARRDADILVVLSA